MLLQYFVDAKRDTTIGTLKFFYQKNKIIVFKKKSTKQKIEDFFLRKKQKYSGYYSVNEKLKKVKKTNITIRKIEGGSRADFHMVHVVDKNQKTWGVSGGFSLLCKCNKLQTKKGTVLVITFSPPTQFFFSHTPLC